MLNLNLEGCLEQFKHRPITFLKHRGRDLSDEEARAVINYGITNGLETINDISDEVADNILNRTSGYGQYYPLWSTRYISEERVREVLSQTLNPEEYSEDDIDEIIRQF